MKNASSIRFFHKLRLRVFAVLGALLVAAIAVISLSAWPAIPVVSVTLITAAAVLNTMTSKLTVSVCTGCGQGLAGVPTGAYGAVCPGCGVLNSGQPFGWNAETKMASQTPTETDESHSS